MQLLRVFLVLALSWTACACNTMEGMGRDLEGAGDAISDTASETKEKM